MARAARGWQADPVAEAVRHDLGGRGIDGDFGSRGRVNADGQSAGALGAVPRRDQAPDRSGRVRTFIQRGARSPVVPRSARKVVARRSQLQHRGPWRAFRGSNPALLRTHARRREHDDGDDAGAERGLTAESHRGYALRQRRPDGHRSFQQHHPEPRRPLRVLAYRRRRRLDHRDAAVGGSHATRRVGAPGAVSYRGLVVSGSVRRQHGRVDVVSK